MSLPEDITLHDLSLHTLCDLLERDPKHYEAGVAFRLKVAAKLQDLLDRVERLENGGM